MKVLRTLREILEPLKIYSLEEGSLIFGELRSYAEIVCEIFEQIKRDDEEFWKCEYAAMLREFKLPQTFDEIEQSADSWLVF